MRLRALTLLASLAGCATFAAPDPGADRAYHADCYDRLLGPGRKDNPMSVKDVDVDRLRRGAPGWTPFDAALRDALARDDTARASALADQVLAVNFADVEAHVVKAHALQDAGKREAATLHETLARGLLASLVRGGDPRSNQRPFRIATPRERDVVLGLLGARDCEYGRDGATETARCLDRMGRPLTVRFAPR